MRSVWTVPHAHAHASNWCAYKCVLLFYFLFVFTFICILFFLFFLFVFFLCCLQINLLSLTGLIGFLCQSVDQLLCYDIGQVVPFAFKPTGLVHLGGQV